MVLSNISLGDAVSFVFTLYCTKFVIESLILREFLYHRKVFSCAAVCVLIYQVKLMKLLSFADFMRQRNYGREMPPLSLC